MSCVDANIANLHIMNTRACRINLCDQFEGVCASTMANVLVCASIFLMMMNVCPVLTHNVAVDACGCIDHARLDSD